MNDYNAEVWDDELYVTCCIASLPTPESDSRFGVATAYALGTGAVAAVLKMIPNQPVQCDVSLLTQYL